MKSNSPKNFLKPAEGRRVRDPITKKPMPADGMDVGELSPYWHRRLRDGDVVTATPARKPSTPTSGK